VAVVGRVVTDVVGAVAGGMTLRVVAGGGVTTGVSRFSSAAWRAFDPHPTATASDAANTAPARSIDDSRIQLGIR
jgi:hypothetical protein